MNSINNRDDKGFRKLLVWQRAHELVLSVYKMTEKFPKSEMFALTSQLRRAVVSIPANIAEGQGAGTKPQFVRYLDIAKGSLSEVEYYLVLSKDLEYINAEKYKKAETLRGEVGFLLYRLIGSMRK
jgi:four helix bundle protein